MANRPRKRAGRGHSRNNILWLGTLVTLAWLGAAMPVFALTTASSCDVTAYPDGNDPGSPAIFIQQTHYNQPNVGDLRYSVHVIQNPDSSHGRTVIAQLWPEQAPPIAARDSYQELLINAKAFCNENAETSHVDIVGASSPAPSQGGGGDIPVNVIADWLNSFSATPTTTDTASPKAHHDQARAYQKGNGVPQDNRRAEALYQQACDAGYAPSCTNLGFMYGTGSGVKENHGLAVDYYLKGCDGNDMRACGNLGVMYRDGLGVMRDTSRALELFNQACNGGFADSCHNLGWMFRHGKGVAQDNVSATDFFRHGCEGGYADSCVSLGYSYENGLGVAADAKRASQFYQQGCEAGSPIGCGNLANHYKYGQGVEQDERRAKALYQQACDGGHDKSCKQLSAIADKAVVKPKPKTLIPAQPKTEPPPESVNDDDGWQYL